MNIAETGSIDAVLDEVKPWAVINAAGFVRVDEAEEQSEECLRVNAKGAALLAAACARHAAKFVTFSSDLVFDGTQGRPYLESDHTGPLNVYGQSKMMAKNRVQEILPESLIIRSSSFFGPWDEHNFVTKALRALLNGETFTAPGDVIISPTYVVDLVHASLDLLIDGEDGVWHLANKGTLSWADLARRAVELAGITTGEVEARPLHTLGFAAQRPRYSALGSERGQVLPALDDALERYFAECEWLASMSNQGFNSDSEPNLGTPELTLVEKCA